MARDELDRAKRAKLDALQLSDTEWERVNLFLSLLKVSSIYEFAISYSLILSHSANISTPTPHSKPFHLKTVLRYTSHCLL
jgi:hypothetical protein